MSLNKKPKVLLVVVYCGNMIKMYEEAGVSMIAAFLRSYQYEVKIIAQTEKNIDYDFIAAYSPKIIGFTVYKVSKAVVGRVSLKIREILSDSLLCLGGYEASCQAERLLNEMPHIDLCIRGEGEKTFFEVVKAIENAVELDNIEGITFRKGTSIISNADRRLIEDLDTLPYMSRDILKNNNLHVAQIWTSRGCNGYCTFCISETFWKKWRGRSIKNVVDEIEYVKNTYKIDTFYFIDGSFEDPDEDCTRLENLAQAIIDRDLNIYYMALFRSEFVRKATPKLMELLVKSGLFTAFVGVEAANADDLKLFCKRGSLDDSKNIMELFKSYKIGLQLGFILYNPYSKCSNIVKNIEFLVDNNYVTRFLGYVVLEGTPLSKKIERDGLINSQSFFGYNFQNSYVEKIIIFINNYLDEITDLKSTYQILNNITNDLIFVYPNILRRCERYQLNEYMKYMLQYYDQCLSLVSDANYIIGNWLKSLFEIKEAQWDEQDIIEKSQNYWTNSQLQKIINRLQLKRNKFYMEINSYNIPNIDELTQLII